MIKNNTFLKFQFGTTLVLVSLLFIPAISLAYGIYVPPIPAPPPLPTVPYPVPPDLPSVPTTTVPALPPPTSIVPTLPTTTLPTPPGLPTIPTLPLPPTVLPPAPVPTPPDLPTPPVDPDPPSLPIPPTNPTPPPLPPAIPIPVPNNPSAEAYLSVWTDGYATPVTSGSRSIGSSDQVTRLSWSSINSSACEGSGYSTNGNVSGDIYNGDPSLVIDPGGTNTYRVRCKNIVNEWSGWKNISISKDNLPVAPINSAPTAPVIKGADMSTAAPVGITVNGVAYFTIKATDPDLDPIAYLVDWDMDNNVDENLPSNNYVPEGTTQSTTRSWSVLGSQSFQVMAIDDKGNKSAWTTHTLVVSDATVLPPEPPQVSLSVEKSLIRSGEKTTAHAKIKADYVLDCNLSGIAGGVENFTHPGGASEVIYSYDTNYLSAAQTIQLECVPNVVGATLQTELRSARVNAVPVIEEV